MRLPISSYQFWPVGTRINCMRSTSRIRTLFTHRVKRTSKRARLVTLSALKRTSRFSSCGCKTSIKRRSTQDKVSGETNVKKTSICWQRKRLISHHLMMQKKTAWLRNSSPSPLPRLCYRQQERLIPLDSDLPQIRRLHRGRPPMQTLKLQSNSLKFRLQLRCPPKQAVCPTMTACKRAIILSCERRIWVWQRKSRL